MSIVFKFGKRVFVFAVVMLVGAVSHASAPSCQSIFSASEVSWTSQIKSARKLFLENITDDHHSLTGIRKLINNNYNDP